jgi:hypothetical protein
MSKDGGGHWLGEVSFAGRGKKLDFDDLGFMDRQNYGRLGAYVEYRTLEPWWKILETHTWIRGFARDNWDGLALERFAYFQSTAVLSSHWSLALGGFVLGQVFDDREVGDGTALERDTTIGYTQSITTDPRSPVVLSVMGEEDNHNSRLQGGVTWRPLPNAELQVLPTLWYNFGEQRYAGTGDTATDLVFGRLSSSSAGATLRASYTFVPTVTLDTYSQLFLATGHYSNFTHFTEPTSGPHAVVHISDLVPGSPPPTSADFEEASLAINVVLRWEFSLGSTLFFVYARSQNPNVTLDPGQLPRLDFNAVRTAPAADTFMVKVAYWIG